MTPAEHYAQAEGLIAEAERMGNDAADLAAQDARGAAQGKLDAMGPLVALAQVHATLALVPTPVEPVELVGQPGDSATPAPGSRVVMLLPSARRAFPVMGSDAFGTVLFYVGLPAAGRVANGVDPADAVVRVKWDDLGEPTDQLVSELRVVLGV